MAESYLNYFYQQLMASLTFQQSDDDCCFSSFFHKRNAKTANQKIEEKTLTQKIVVRKVQPSSSKFKTANKSKFKESQCKAKESIKLQPNNHISSSQAKRESSKIRRLVNVRLDYSIQNCEILKEGDRKIEIQEVESEICKEQVKNDGNNIVVVQSEILHDYFNQAQSVNLDTRLPTATKKVEDKKKIKRLFKTQAIQSPIFT